MPSHPPPAPHRPVGLRARMLFSVFSVFYCFSSQPLVT